MLFEDLEFGSIKVDRVEYAYDIIVDCGEIRKRKKGPSKESVVNSATRPFPQKRISLGVVAGS